MKRILYMIGSLFLSVPSGTMAMDSEKPPVVEDTSPEAARAAAKEASSEADKWAGKKTEKKPAAVEAPTPVTVNSSTTPATTKTDAVKTEAAKTEPSQAEPAKTAPAKTEPPKPASAKKGLNEMKGKLLSKSYDPATIRMTVAGGFSVEFTYDRKSTIVNGGSKIDIEDLNYNDELIIWYSGKNLYAIEIDRTSKAPRPE